MLLARQDGDDVPRPDLFDRAALALNAADPCGYDQGLTERVRMPAGPRATFKGDDRADMPAGLLAFEGRVDPDLASKPIIGSGGRWLRAGARDVDDVLLLVWLGPT
jgi:hypothetical protein